jgi:hypothetical protein
MKSCALCVRTSFWLVLLVIFQHHKWLDSWDRFVPTLWVVCESLEQRPQCSMLCRVLATEHGIC